VGGVGAPIPFSLSADEDGGWEEGRGSSGRATGTGKETSRGRERVALP
jgi:hypothetical protein